MIFFAGDVKHYHYCTLMKASLRNRDQDLLPNTNAMQYSGTNAYPRPDKKEKRRLKTHRPVRGIGKDVVLNAMQSQASWKDISASERLKQQRIQIGAKSGIDRWWRVDGALLKSRRRAIRRSTQCLKGMCRTQKLRLLHHLGDAVPLLLEALVLFVDLRIC